MQIVTFDFHNTVAHCDPWFDLEIRQLPAAVLTHLAEGGTAPAPALLDAVTLRYRELRERVKASGIELDAQSCVVQVFEETGIEADADAIATAIERLMRDCLPALEPVSGAIDTITALIDNGVQVGIVSSAVYHPFLVWALESFGLLHRLAFVATSASIGFYKSDVRIYHHAYDLVNATPELGVHVGDSPRWDVATAQDAGLAAVLYTAPGTNRPELTHDAMPDLVLTSMIDAAEPILRLLRERAASAAAS